MSVTSTVHSECMCTGGFKFIHYIMLDMLNTGPGLDIFVMSQIISIGLPPKVRFSVGNGCENVISGTNMHSQ